MSVQTDQINVPIPVEIKNWAPAIKPPFVKKTTVRTYVLDPAGIVGVGKNVQIADYEPQRLRMAIIVSDQSITLTIDPPSVTPDVTTIGSAPQGAFLPVSNQPYEFFGPDAAWINSILANTTGRVTVIKEFC